MQELGPEGSRLVDELARRHGVSREAVLVLLDALVAGNGTQAQFNHPDLGGMGQWSRGGMIMVGDMFNQGLKHRIDSLCNELAEALGREAMRTPVATSQTQTQGAGVGVSLFVQGSSRSWWPADLGVPASVGAQNDLRYAYFPASRRLAIDQAGHVRVFDTGDHRITGFSQQQGGDQSLTFTSQHGLVRVVDLPRVTGAGEAPPERDAPPPTEPERPAPSREERSGVAQEATSSSAMSSPDAILSAIERLADLRQKNILTEEEFSAKKADLLGRL